MQQTGFDKFGKNVCVELQFLSMWVVYDGGLKFSRLLLPAEEGAGVW